MHHFYCDHIHCCKYERKYPNFFCIMFENYKLNRTVVHPSIKSIDNIVRLSYLGMVLQGFLKIKTIDYNAQKRNHFVLTYCKASSESSAATPFRTLWKRWVYFRAPIRRLCTLNWMASAAMSTFTSSLKYSEKKTPTNHWGKKAQNGKAMLNRYWD